MINDTLVGRLSHFISSSGFTTTQFADAARIPRPTLSQILSGRNKKVSNEVLEKLHSAFPSLDIIWLLFGEESRNLPDSSSEPLSVFGGNSVHTASSYKSSKESPPGYSEVSMVNDFEDMAPYGNPRTSEPSLFDTGGFDRHSVYNSGDMTADGRSVSNRESPAASGRTAPPPDSDALSSETAMPAPCPESAPEAASSGVRDHTTLSSGRAIVEGADEDTQNNRPERRVVSVMVLYSDNSFEVFKSQTAGLPGTI